MINKSTVNDKRLGKEERILHVIEIAKKLFLEQGYSATTTAQIAREAEIAELTLFRYFPTKRKLFEAVIQPLISFDDFARDLLNERPLEYIGLLNLLRKRVTFVKQERDLVRLVVVESQFQSDLAGEFNPVRRIAGQVRKLLSSKGLSEDTCQIIVQLIMGFLLSIAFAHQYDEQTIDTTQKLTEEQILQLLQADFKAQRI